jgi:hypothetical protein
MHPTVRPPLAEEAAHAKRWWLPGLVWWLFFVGLLLLAVHEFA